MWYQNTVRYVKYVSGQAVNLLNLKIQGIWNTIYTLKPSFKWSVWSSLGFLFCAKESLFHSSCIMLKDCLTVQLHVVSNGSMECTVCIKMCLNIWFILNIMNSSWYQYVNMRRTIWLNTTKLHCGKTIECVILS